MNPEKLIERIFDPNENVEELCLAVCHFQLQHNEIYRRYCALIGKSEVHTFSEIPFIPIQFFKTHRLVSSLQQEKLVFKSSGTGTGDRSQHFVIDPRIYERSFLNTFESFFGKCEDLVIFALLPNYLEQGSSSLVYMVDYLIQKSNNQLSGFYKDDFNSLLEKYALALTTGKKIVLFGVSYALLDLAELKPNLSQALIIETGGMKGRRKELLKEELHEQLKSAFSVTHIFSEYGMTELLSQGYLMENSTFQFPHWMCIQIRDINDPFQIRTDGKTGGINVIDLANIYSCSFIETQDLGQMTDTGLKLMGRYDHSDIRGCNLMVE